MLTPTGTADVRDYTLTGAFDHRGPGSEISNHVELEVRADDDVSMDTLMFDATVSGEAAKGTETSPSAGVLALTIVDATDQQIIPLSSTDVDTLIDGKIAAGAGEDGLNPGESFTFEPSELFTSPGRRLRRQLRNHGEWRRDQ